MTRQQADVEASAPAPRSRRRRLHSPVQEPLPDFPPELEQALDGEPSEQEISDAERLFEFQSKFEGRNYRVRVQRFNKEESDWAWINRYPLDGFDAFNALKVYGTGKYRMTLLDENGKYVKGGQSEILLEIPQTQTSQAPAPMDPLSNPVVAAMIENMKSANAQTTEILKALLTRPEPVNTQKPATMSDLIEGLHKLKSLAPNEQTGNAKLKETLELVALVNSVAGKGDGGGDESFLGQIKDAIGAAKEMGVFDKLAAARRPNPPPTSLIDRPTPQVVNLPQREVAAVNSPILEGLKPYVAIFKSKAENGVSVDDAADFLVDELYSAIIPLLKRNFTMAKFASDDVVADNLCNRAQDPEQIAGVFVFAPELEQHRDWIVGVIAKAVQTLTNPEEVVNADTEQATA